MSKGTISFEILRYHMQRSILMHGKAVHGSFLPPSKQRLFRSAEGNSKVSKGGGLEVQVRANQKNLRACIAVLIDLAIR